MTIQGRRNWVAPYYCRSAMVESTRFGTKDRTGEVIGDRYEIVALLGRGGQSAVYRARDRRDGDEVALKILLPNTDPASAERMYREAFAMSSLQGTAAVRVLGQVKADDGAIGLVLELLPGCDLDEYLTQCEKKGARLPIAKIREIIEPVVETLEAAHTNGIVHRDIKPANIWVIDDEHGGGVRLLDFGFAKLTRAVPITGKDDAAGTPTYMAPEIWLRGSRSVDRRADVYSLAVLLFRLVGGRLPFEGSLVEILRSATSARRPSLHALRPDLPPAVDDWVALSLAIERDERFETVRAMWRALLSSLGV